VAHFVQYGGGNALVLVDGPNPATVEPETGGPPKQYVSGKSLFCLSFFLALSMPMKLIIA
jgi:hypothetical protein